MDKDLRLVEINHFIDRAEAKRLITNYQEMQYELVNPNLVKAQKEYGVLPTWEAFNEKSILAILAQPGCEGIRIHYGLKKEDKSGEIVPMVVAVLVGVDKEGNSMWGAAAVTKPTAKMQMKATERGAEDEGVILEDSQRCPPYGDSSPMP
jgi:hypothetical protein